MGLGAAHAATLAREGARVVLTDIDESAGKATAAGIPGSIFLGLDVRNESGWMEVIAATERQFGRLDVLVNNAGLVRFASIEDCTLEDYRFLNGVMSEGTFLGCKYAIPAMVRSGGGSIINTSSVAALRGKGMIPAYTAAKGAIMSLTLSVAAHCRDRAYPIRCNVILAARRHFGIQDGDLTGVHIGPINGVPQDVADLVLFLASDESRGITGTHVVIDNGEIIA
jgi:3(or 17)beta-hydroxysteroid dehydrogenase